MKKHIIAAAVAAAVAVPAMAQNVTLYGIVDQGYVSKKYDNNAYTATADGKFTSFGGTNQGSALASQRIGFKGSEDLGGGMKANFTFELGFLDAQQINTATNTARIATVGLSGGFGSLDIGRNKTASQLVMEAYTAGGANNFIGDAFNYNDAKDFGGGAAVFGLRPVASFILDRANGVHYLSPNLNGFLIRATYANQENKDSDGAASANDKVEGQDISVTYTGIKGLNVGISRGEGKARAAAATASTKGEVTQVGASYALGAATVFAQYADSKAKGTNGAQSSAFSGYQVGVRYAVSNALTVRAQYHDSEEESTSGTKVSDRTGYQLGAEYGLSARTTLYAMYGVQEAERATTKITNKVDGLAIGVRHSF